MFDYYEDFFTMVESSSNFLSSFQLWDSVHNFSKMDDLSEYLSGSFESILLYQGIGFATLFSFMISL